QSQTDPLTNVYNRVTAEGIIESTLNSEKNKTHALLMMDIDDFKSINDTYGHAAGDNTLLEISKYLKSFFRQGDIVARLGGDEFIVFVADISSTEIIKDKCDNLCKAIADLEIGDEHISVSCSIGIAVSEGEESDFACLYRNADKALYMAKSMGKNQSRLYNKNDMQS
ncbi:MAG: GGDEF domain-containing protein, partial [Oscillospiraceae bacterium]